MFGRRNSRLSRWITLALWLLAQAAAQAEDGERGQLFEGRDATLYFEVRGRGAGTPLVVVNGGPGFDHRYLHTSPVWESVARRRRVVFYDQRGNGGSPALKPGQSCTLADQIADLDALRDHLGFAKIALLGHSWGGYLAMAYAAYHPERIERLILSDSAAPKWSETVFLFKSVFPETVARQEALAFAVERGDKEALAADLRQYFSMLFYSLEKRDTFLAKASTFVFRREVNQALTSDLSRHDLRLELPKFRFPTLVITGRYDMNVAPSVAYQIHQQISESRFVVFEHSGHLPFYEEPREFVRLLEQFLAVAEAR